MKLEAEEEQCRGEEYIRLDKEQKALSVQLILSLAIGLTALLAFCVKLPPPSVPLATHPRTEDKTEQNKY